MFDNLIEKFSNFLWRSRPGPLAWWKRFLLFVGRLLFRVFLDVNESHITLRAMSLVFTTLLAIVPLLAVSFSVLKGFGAHNQYEPLLLGALQGLGEKGEEISRKIIDFVENVKVGMLGTLGLAFLFYTAISLVQKVEVAFNNIWHLQQSRTVMRRISDYLSLLIIGPILIFSALSLSAAMQSNAVVQGILAIEPLGSLYRFGISLLPYMLVISAFTFFYMFIPNTRVKFQAALIGGLVSGIIWQTVSWGFASFVASSTNYTAIYSGLAILIFFMIWVYVNWLILLLGADLVFHLQHPENLTSPRHRLRLSIARKESLALRILCVIGRAFYAGKHGVGPDELSQQLGVPGKLLDETLDLLIEGKLIGLSDTSPPAYLPLVPFDETTVKQAMDTIRGAQDFSGDIIGGFERVDAILEKADQQLNSVLSSTTLKQLATADN
jgi:membrane protein